MRRSALWLTAVTVLLLLIIPAGAQQNQEVSFALSSVSVKLINNSPMAVNLQASCPGELVVSSATDGTELGHTPVKAGSNTLSVLLQKNGEPLPAGSYSVLLTLVSAEGVSSRSRQVSIRVEQEEGADTPEAKPEESPEPEPSPEAQDGPWDLSLLDQSVSQSQLLSFQTVNETENLSLEHPVYAGALRASEDENSYWTMELGNFEDEQAIWDIMMQPITILDDHKHSAKETYKLRKTPDSSTSRSNVVGEVTYRSQGVHVVEQLDSGWTLVEAYNTSYGDTYKKDGKVAGYGKTAQLIQGYVKTDVLQQVEPKQDYALLIDKYTQTMYIFSKGKIIGTLLVSTGKVNASQPWNETPAGEFLIVSWTGGFWAGNLYCDMGLLLNNGCLIHEVPALVRDQETGYKDYSTTTPYLGQKASHGCVRVQRTKNENGQNMKWLWDNLSINTKVIIWDDATRYTNYPDDSLVLYYNQIGGNRYHLNQYCHSVNKRYHPLTAFTYGELTEEPYDELVPCQSCTPPERPETIQKKNLNNGYPF